MKYLVWIGSTLKIVNAFPREIREDIGFQLDSIQQEFDQLAFEDEPSIGVGVKRLQFNYKENYGLLFLELKWEVNDITAQLSYINKPKGLIYILHAFTFITEECLNKHKIFAKEILKTIEWPISE